MQKYPVLPNTHPRKQEGHVIASEYQKIHPNSVVDVNNVKINTKMMREWPIFKQAHLWVHVKNLVFL